MDSRWTAEEADQIAAAARKRAHAEEELARSLPRRNPGSHWTGPSGEHVEVPITPRTLTNIRNWGRVIQ